MSQQAASSPTTARSAPRQRFRWIRGRRYIEGSSYIGPKDAAADNFLDFQHFIVRKVLGGNHQAPLQAPGAILDAGCGTGRWVVEMALEFPMAQVVGLDLVPPDNIAPLLASQGLHATNVAFVAADLLQPLPFPDATFDYVHQQLLFDDLQAQRWPNILRELVRVTRPGGWVECAEPAEEIFDPGPGYQRMSAWTARLCRERGLDPDMGPKLRLLLQGAGLEQVTERAIPAFPDRTPSRERRLWQAQALGAYETVFRDALLAAGIVTEDRYAAALALAHDEFAQGSYANSDILYVAFGRRPPGAASPHTYERGLYGAVR
ncbi:MAG: methyltransferase domain-containing protein [Ktedonobacterales bacterium]